MGLYLVLVPRLDDLIALNQAQGREIEIAPSRPRASLGELDLALVLTTTSLLEVQPQRLAVTAAIRICPWVQRV